MKKLAVYVIVALFSACSATRYVGEGQYLLNRNVIETDKNAPHGERIKEADLDRFVRQIPGRKLLRTNIPISIYNMSDTANTNLPNRFVRTLGSKPVVMDSAMILRSAANIESYMRSRGFYDSRLDWRVDTRGKKATVTYAVTQGEPYRIGSIRYNFRDEFLAPVVSADTARSLVRRGDIFDIGVLNAERARITEYLRNQGYYNFTVNNIGYVADSTGGNRTVDLTLNLRQYLAGYNDEGQPEFENNSIYRLGTIFINPAYDPVAAATDPDYFQKLDTMEYRGLNIIYEGRPRVRPRVLRQAVKLYPNAFYSASDVQDTYDGVMRLGYFRSASILFENVTDSSRMNETTFIGSDDSADHAETTNEGYLQCNINCIPALRQSYKLDLEGSISSNFYAIGVAAGYQNRNLFRGAELFDLNLTGRYEFTRTSSSNGSYEIGGNTSLSFPQFLLPFSVDPYARLQNPRTRFELSINYQHRPIYHRTLSGVRLAYSWSNRSFSTFVLRPVDVNLINVSFLDPKFAEGLKNPYLLNSYQTQLVPGISFSYTYNNQLEKPNANSVVFKLNVETMGNLFSGLSRIFSEPRRDEELEQDYYHFLGYRFAQYARFEASFSNRIVTGSNTSFVWRVLAGAGLSYGNSTTIPIDRMFFSGGSNSMRGWVARRLGPGQTPAVDSDYPSQVGNMKLEANVEFRFPIWDFFNGAVFADVGNVWFVGQRDHSATDDAGLFRFNSFYKQLGFNTGFGLRLDFSRFIFRVDWGIPLHDPGKLAGSRWIRGFKLNNTALNFAVGYPF